MRRIRASACGSSSEGKSEIRSMAFWRTAELSPSICSLALILVSNMAMMVAEAEAPFSWYREVMFLWDWLVREEIKSTSLFASCHRFVCCADDVAGRDVDLPFWMSKFRFFLDFPLRPLQATVCSSKKASMPFATACSAPGLSTESAKYTWFSSSSVALPKFPSHFLSVNETSAGLSVGNVSASLNSLVAKSSCSMSFRYSPPSDESSDTEADLLFKLSVEISLDKLVRSVAADCEAVSVLDSSSDEPLLFPGLKRAACPLLAEGSNSVYCSSIALCFMGSRSSRARCNRSRSSGSKSRNIAYTRAGSTGGQYSLYTGQQPRCTCTGVRI